MSLQDLNTITGKLLETASHIPRIDPGLVLTWIGVAILSLIALYITVKITIWTVRRIADMTPSQFFKLVTVLGLVFLVAGLLAP